MINLQAYVTAQEAAGLAAKDAVIAALQQDVIAKKNTISVRDGIIASMTGQLVTLQAAFDAYKASHPDVTPPPPPPPPTTGFPDATNTGPVAGTVFKPATGSITISTPGTYNGLVVNGWITVTANSGVIITNSKITGGGIQADNGKTITVKNCIIDGQTQQGAGIQAFGFFDKNNIRGFENGIVVQAGSGGWAKDNYIHDLTSPAADAHIDGIAIQEAVSGFTIDHNSIWSWDTSCVFMRGNWGPINNIVVSNNLLRVQPGKEGQTAYVINVDGRDSPITNIKVLNNKAQKAYYGYFTFDTVTGPVTVTGNTDYATGAPVT